jgi:hypothetical protein
MVAPIGKASTKQQQRTFTEDEWKASPYFDPDVSYDPGMTEERLRAHAEWKEAREYRESLLARSPGGFGRTATGLAVALGVSAIDPVNYIPFFGPAARARAVARFGQIGGRALTSGAEAAVGTAALDAIIAPDLIARGVDVTAADVALDIALGS